MADTVFNIQIGEHEFVNIWYFVRTQRLRKVSFDEAKRKRRYTVVVFRDLTVARCFITGTSRPNMMRAVHASRGGKSFSIYRDDVEEIYQ